MLTRIQTQRGALDMGHGLQWREAASLQSLSRRELWGEYCTVTFHMHRSSSRAKPSWRSEGKTACGAAQQASSSAPSRWRRLGGAPGQWKTPTVMMKGKSSIISHATRKLAVTILCVPRKQPWFFPSSCCFSSGSSSSSCLL